MPNITENPAIPGWGVDAPRENRPGVPMEKSSPTPSRTWPQQVARVPVIHKRSDTNQLTPVFGTTCPPKGLSGIIRRAAYRITDDKPSHWMLLMLGDRVDVIESAAGEAIQNPATALFITLGAAALTLAYLKNRQQRRSIFSR